MKYLAIAALVAASFVMGACAHKAETTASTSSMSATASTGYKK